MTSQTLSSELLQFGDLLVFRARTAADAFAELCAACAELLSGYLLFER